jgi:hypothetical protein
MEIGKTRIEAGAVDFALHFRYLDGGAPEPQSCPLGLLARYFQPFPPFVVHLPTAVLQESSDSPVPVPAKVACQPDGIVGQDLLVFRTCGFISLGGPGLA